MAIAAPPEVPAVVAAAADVIAYPAPFFADAQPTNAFDMLRRVPGFTFSAGAEVRGFAGAAGNVLIDGERPSLKSVSLQDVLQRIPAGSVERIDLIRGGAPGIDMQGQALVANVIRSRAIEATAAVRAGVGLYPDGWIAPRLELEWSRRRGNLSFEGGLTAAWEKDDESGAGARSRILPSGAVVESGRLEHMERGPTLSGNATVELDQGPDVWRLNLGGRHQWENTLETIVIADGAGRLLGGEVSTEGAKRRDLEIGGDYEHTFGERLSARLVALQTLERDFSRQRLDDPSGVQTFDSLERSGESILRGTITARPSAAWTVEGGGEGAFNFLEAESAATEGGRAVQIPNANVRVEERRAEGFVTGFWKPSARFSLEAGARVEGSRISQSGDTRQSRSFFFPKPRVQATYTPDAASQLRVRVEREVGQLEFGDFAATSELSVGTVNAGNADLEPERSWVVEAAAERRFWGKGALVATFTHAEVSQIVDLIPIDGRFDAPGNIGDGRRDRLKVTATVPLDRAGIGGGLVVVEATWRWSKVTDPVTGERRRASFENPLEGTVRFTQDIPQWRSTWGIDGTFATVNHEYRIDEIARVTYEARWGAFWEWKPQARTTIRAEIQNATSRDFRRVRRFFDGPRSVGNVVAIERRNSRFDPFFFLSIRREL